MHDRFRTDLHRERHLDVDQHPARPGRPVPAQEGPQHHPGAVPLPPGRPRAAQVEPVQGPLQPGRQRLLRGQGRVVGQGRHLVQRGADGLRRGVRTPRTDRLHQPAQLAGHEAVQRGRRDPDRPAGLAERAGVGQLDQPPPGGRVRPGHTGGRQPGQLAGGGPAPGVDLLRVRDHRAQLGDQGGQAQRPRHRGERPGGAGGRRVQLVQEAGRQVLVAGDAGDDQQPPGPGDRDVEQPPLLVQQRRDRREPFRLPAGGDVDQVLDAEQGAAPAQVRPAALLHADHRDDRPLQTLGRVRGEQPDRVPGRRLRRQRVAGDLLAGQVVEQHPRAGARQPVDEAGRHVEERHHRVQVAVRRGTGRPAAPAGPLPLVAEAGRGPDRPQHLLGGAAVPGRRPGGGQQPADPPRRLPHPPPGRGPHHPVDRRHRRGDPRLPRARPARARPGSGDDLGGRGRRRTRVRGGAGIAQQSDQQPRRATGAAGDQVEPAQLLPQPAQRQRVRAAQRRGQQRQRGLLVQRVRAGLRPPGSGGAAGPVGPQPPQRAVQQPQERRHRRLRDQRHLLAGHRGGHAGHGERPAQRRQVPLGGADHHRHLPPRHPVEQVRGPQPVRHVRGLLAGRAQHVHLGATGRGAGSRPQRPVRGRAGQPDRDPPARGEQHRAGPPGGVQRDRGHRRPVGRRECVGEAADGVRVGAAEGVDRLVRVADRDQLVGPVRQHPEQLLLRRVDVLILVDEDPPAPGPLPGEQLRVGAECVDGGADQLGRVVRLRPLGRGQRGHVQVLVEELRGGDPVVPAAGPAPPGQHGRADAALHRPQQQVAQLAGEAAGQQRRPQRRRPVGGAQLDVAGEQLADEQVLLRPGQQPRAALAAGDRLLPEQAEGVRVEGARQRLAGGPGQPRGDPLPQVGGGAPAEGQQQQRLGVDAAPGDPVHGRLDQRGRLAGAGAGEHQQRPAAVPDDGALAGVERRRDGQPAGRADQPVRRRRTGLPRSPRPRHADDRTTTGRLDRRTRTACRRTITHAIRRARIAGADAERAGPAGPGLVDWTA